MEQFEMRDRLKVRFSVLFLLFGLSLTHFTVVFAQDHEVFNSPVTHLILGMTFFVFAILFYEYGYKTELSAWILLLFLVPVLLIFFESFVMFKNTGFLLEQLIEHSNRIILPILGAIIVWQDRISAKIYFVLRLSLALTFVGHGLFAIGFHYIPGNFMLMSTRILSMSGDQAEGFLLVMGILDFVAAILIFSRGRLVIIGLAYMAFWGFVTAAARVTYGLIEYSDWSQILYYFGNTLLRLPNGLLPLLLLRSAYKSRPMFQLKSIAVMDLFGIK